RRLGAQSLAAAGQYPRAESPSIRCPMRDARPWLELSRAPRCQRDTRGHSTRTVRDREASSRACFSSLLLEPASRACFSSLLLEPASRACFSSLLLEPYSRVF